MLIKLLLIITLFASQAFAEVNINIICSSFPVYDFTRAITTEDVKLLLRPGTEPHEFEPSAMDVKALNDSRAFVYTNNNLETWAEKIARSLNKDTAIIDASRNIEIINNDPHVWLDLSRASQMVRNIYSGLVSAGINCDDDNMKEYLSRLAELDAEFMRLPKNKVLVFAGEFSYSYFLERYGIKYISAYDGENEPGVKKLAQVIKYIQDNDVKYILSDINISQITRSISSQTGAKILIFNTAHMSGESDNFIGIMTQNLENLKLALNHDGNQAQ